MWALDRGGGHGIGKRVPVKARVSSRHRLFKAY